jgi:hypothetical protein
MRRAAGGRGDPGRQRRKTLHPSNKGEERETLFDPPGPKDLAECRPARDRRRAVARRENCVFRALPSVMVKVTAAYPCTITAHRRSLQIYSAKLASRALLALHFGPPPGIISP